ncbi:glucokinase [Arenimonas composti]|uniref:Glucokinase n=1 Tax=Arenimonas composti TR7-09 = DSM 18010 TaxID=1121013 RepID=A0A091BGG7_9GAMM|nr:glucokinase [Arenimonas composti]KFN50846.1 hypothetical protein P873_00430 [Arenimonas composti TR7-09 = DSM 18010]
MAGAAGTVLLADIGGTHARFALADPDAESPLLADSQRTFAVAGFAGPEAAARAYLDAFGAAPRRAVFAVAALVDGDELELTNHPWRLSRPALMAALALDDLRFVNDFEAMARALPLLRGDDVVALGGPGFSVAGLDDDADRCWAVLGAGTGLGVAGLIRREGRVFALPGEGGHIGFAPATAEEIDVLRLLHADFGRVSVERVVSGGGLANLYRALAQRDGGDGEALAPADVVARAGAGEPRARRAIELFCALYGAVAGDIALAFGAWDGVFLTGGLVPRLLEALQQGGFRRRFEDKGRFAAAMARLPTLAVRHPQPGLLGAAAIAADATTEGRR